MKINKVLCYALGVATVINFGLVVYMANIVKDARDNVGEYLQSPVSVSIGEPLSKTAITTIIGGTKTGLLLGDLKATDSGEIVVGEVDWDTLDASQFSYASATSITVSGADATEIFQIGDRLRLIQTTTKYFYVIGVTSTSLTITGGDDYSLANAVITEISFSRDSVPAGFPVEFNYTPTITSDNPLTVTSQGTADVVFSMEGSRLTYEGVVGSVTLGGSADTGLYISLPVDWNGGDGNRGFWAYYLGVATPSQPRMFLDNANTSRAMINIGTNHEPGGLAFQFSFSYIVEQ